ncbi:MAG: hypothetical protein ABI468_01220 [Candidatus Nanopelagicales bacterium]
MSDPRKDAAEQTERLVDRLRHLALTRLQAPYQPEATRVEAALTFTQRLADAAAALEQPVAPTWRDVPTVSAAGAGDLLAICAHDALAGAAALEDGAAVPRRGGGSTTVADLLGELAAGALELRRRL